MWFIFQNTLYNIAKRRTFCWQHIPRKRINRKYFLSSMHVLQYAYSKQRQESRRKWRSDSRIYLIFVWWYKVFNTHAFEFEKEKAIKQWREHKEKYLFTPHHPFALKNSNFDVYTWRLSAIFTVKTHVFLFVRRHVFIIFIFYLSTTSPKTFYFKIN